MLTGDEETPSANCWTYPAEKKTNRMKQNPPSICSSVILLLILHTLIWRTSLKTFKPEKIKGTVFNINNKQRVFCYSSFSLFPVSHILAQEGIIPDHQPVLAAYLALLFLAYRVNLNPCDRKSSLLLLPLSSPCFCLAPPSLLISNVGGTRVPT